MCFKKFKETSDFSKNVDNQAVSSKVSLPQHPRACSHTRRFNIFVLIFGSRETSGLVGFDDIK